MTGNAALAVAVIVAIATPVFAWLSANRKLSGKIATTEASELWKASEAMRVELREQIDGLRRDLAAAVKRVDQLERLNSDLVKENSELQRENRELNAKVETLEQENQALTVRVVDLERQLSEGVTSGG